jgi:hypothetical protein
VYLRTTDTLWSAVDEDPSILNDFVRFLRYDTTSTESAKLLIELRDLRRRRLHGLTLSSRTQHSFVDRHCAAPVAEQVQRQRAH